MTSEFHPFRAESNSRELFYTSPPPTISESEETNRQVSASSSPSSTTNLIVVVSCNQDSLGEEENVDAKSSSTEGPDSQNSAASSPTFQQVMIPSYPESGTAVSEGEEQGGKMDDGNEHLPLLPRYFVRFVKDPEKDGDVVKYKLRVGKPEIADGSSVLSTTTTTTVEREYDDFELFHHNLLVYNGVHGVIVPPLPPRPTANPKDAESKSKQQLGSGNRNVRGDDFTKDARAMEKFMQQVLHHPSLGQDEERLREFLDRPKPPVRTKLKKSGFLSGFFDFDMSSIKRGDARCKDVDFFSKERDWVSLYAIHINDTCDKLRSTIHAQMRTANQVSRLSTLLRASVAAGREGLTGFYNRLNAKFATCLEEEKSGLDGSATAYDLLLASHLTHWSSYVTEESGMLHRRSMLLAEVEAAGRELAKATLSGKPCKTSAALERKDKKDKQLKHASDSGEAEIRRFHQQRLSEMKKALVDCAQQQLIVAMATRDKLSECMASLKDFELPTTTKGY